MLCSPKGHCRSEQSHSCKCALLGNAELEQLATERSCQIMRPSSETTGCNLFCSPIPHSMARRKRLWAMSCGNSCLIPCLVGAVGSCSNTVLTDKVVHGQHRPVATEMTDFFPLWVVWSTPQLQPKIIIRTLFTSHWRGIFKRYMFIDWWKQNERGHKRQEKT